MSLQTYESKRNFKKTKEPAPAKKKQKDQHRFVIQKHAASRLHYDFRLELEGALKSWAVPKGPSYDPKEKRLAVHVEDHPIEYGTFEGTIPKGEYGGGTVMVWDTGTWESLDKNANAAYHEGKMKFRLNGEKLQGDWALIRMKPRDNDKGDNWLLIKEKDEFARAKGDILKEEPNSAASGRTMDEITRDAGGDEDNGRTTAKKATAPAKKPAKPKSITLDAEKIAHAKKRSMPSSLKPQLCTLVNEVPTGGEWLHEIKFDGYRIVAFIKGGKVKLVSRNGKVWTDKFPNVAKACEAIGHDCILDGEVVVVRADGTTDFQALQNVLKSRDRSNLAYYVFDITHLDGYNLGDTPLIERKAALQSLMRSLPEDSALRYSTHVEGHGEEVFQKACDLNSEGIISKRADSAYMQTRSKSWVKVKCIKSQEFVIGGYTDPGGSRTGFGALLLGYQQNGKLVYAGRVGTGFNDKSLKTIAAQLKERERKSAPFSNPPKGRDAAGVHWISPDLVCEVAFTEWTSEGILRHPAFKGLREDKPAKKVTREVAKDETSDKPKRSKASKSNGTTVGGVALSNPDKELYEGITKRDLAEYYDAIADRMLPYVADRPLSLLRCPSGRAKHCFFQKHIAEGLPQHVGTVPIKEKNGKEDYLFIKDKEGLIELSNLGTLEFHIWGAHVDNVEKPDILTFDLDPGPNVSNADLVRAVFELRDLLADLGLTSFLNTTGGKGFHILVPIQRRTSWDDLKAFAKNVTSKLAAHDPKRYTTNMSKSKRGGKIFIDYLRNGRGATFIAPFSTRARANAPVSMPIAWDELTPKTNPAAWTVSNALDRPGGKQDPWKDFAKTKQSITKKMQEAVEDR